MYADAFVLDLYCENNKPGDGIHAYHEFPHQFAAYDRAEAFRDARRAGWKINQKERTCFCPKCNKK